MRLASVAPGRPNHAQGREQHAGAAAPLSATRVVIAERSPVIREGLCGVLAGSTVRVVGAAATAQEAAEQVRALAPDVVFLEAQLAEADGFAVLEAIHAGSPKTAVVILSMRGRGRLLEALQRGAACYLLQDGVSRQSLLLAAEAARQGFVLADALALRQVLASRGLLGGERDEAPPHMTPREKEVLALVEQGLSNREIAEALTVSVGTVRSHVSNILSKLGVHHRVQAATLAARWRLDRAQRGQPGRPPLP